MGDEAGSLEGDGGGCAVVYAKANYRGTFTRKELQGGLRFQHLELCSKVSSGAWKRET